MENRQCKAYFPLGDFFRATRSENKIRQHDWLKLAGEKIHREVGSVPTFLSVRANKFAKWKIGLSPIITSGDRSSLVACQKFFFGGGGSTWGDMPMDSNDQNFCR